MTTTTRNAATEGDRHELALLLLNVVQRLPETTRQQALAPSAKDGVEPIARLRFLREFIAQPQPLKGAGDAHQLAQPEGFNHAVNLPGFVADADAHDAAACIHVGFGLDGCQYFVVIGAWSCAINELGVHVDLSDVEKQRLMYAAKYWHKASRADVPVEV